MFYRQVESGCLCLSLNCLITFALTALLLTLLTANHMSCYIHLAIRGHCYCHQWQPLLCLLASNPTSATPSSLVYVGHAPTVLCRCCCYGAVVRRYWRPDLANGACAVVSTSVAYSSSLDGKGSGGAVIAVDLGTSYHVEASGSGRRCRLTYITRVDLRYTN